MLVQARDAALVLGQSLNVLLDLYDFYTERYPAETQSQRFELEDLQVSILELGTLPKQVAEALHAWTRGDETMLSREGFELHVLNEFNVHMNAVSTFMFRKHIDLSEFDARAVGDAFFTLRTTNRLLTTASKDKQ